jgi:hypothetical protein
MRAPRGVRSAPAVLLALLVATPPMPLAKADETPAAPETPAKPKRHAIEYEAGVEVTITSKDPATEIFLAHGDVPIDTMPDPFERIGLTPVTVKLAAGTYSIETASPTQSTGHQRFVVEQGRPLAIAVHAGDANVKGIGAVIAGLGVVTIVLGVVAILSFSPDDSHYNRFGIGITLIAGGAGACGLGVGMTVLGATDVRVQAQPRPDMPKAASAVPALIWAF